MRQLWVLGCCALALASSSTGGFGQTGKIKISVDDARPLAEAVFQLEHQAGMAINFEQADRPKIFKGGRLSSTVERPAAVNLLTVKPIVESLVRVSDSNTVRIAGCRGRKGPADRVSVVFRFTGLRVKHPRQ